MLPLLKADWLWLQSLLRFLGVFFVLFLFFLRRHLLILVQVLSLIFLLLLNEVELLLDSCFERFVDRLLVASVHVLGAELELAGMPIWGCEVVHVANSEIISHQESFELSIVIFWPSVVFHAEWDTH